MGWKKAAAQLGTGAVVSALRVLEPQLKQRDYKRLVATTVAQLLQLYPGLGARKARRWARRWARRATGSRPSKKAVLAMAKIGLKETAEAAVAAAITAGATKVVARLATRAKERLA